MEVQGGRKTGMPKIRWFNRVRDNIKYKGLPEVYHRATWSRKSSNIDPT